MKKEMKDVLEEKKKKALAVTIVIPMGKSEDEEDKALDIPPSLDEEKDEEKEAFLKDAKEVKKKKEKGLKLSLHEKAQAEAMEND